MSRPSTPTLSPRLRLFEEEGLSWVGELDAFGRKTSVDGQIDRLEDVHVRGVVGGLDVVDRLEVEGGVAVGRKV